jgi:hypothetical protein
VFNKPAKLEKRRHKKEEKFRLRIYRCFLMKRLANKGKRKSQNGEIILKRSLSYFNLLLFSREPKGKDFVPWGLF